MYQFQIIDHQIILIQIILIQIIQIVLMIVHQVIEERTILDLEEGAIISTQMVTKPM